MTYDIDQCIKDEVDNHVDIAVSFVDDQTLLSLYRSFVHINLLHTVAADADAGFDGGEFSGPAHGRMVTREVCAAAKAHGYTDYELSADGTYPGILDVLDKIDCRVDGIIIDEEFGQQAL